MKTPQEDEPLFRDFANRFLGYGSLGAPIWLVGPEAGGGESIAEVHNRIRVWDERGRKETEDLQEYHRALKLPSNSNWAENEQRTWATLIRIIFAIGAKDPGENDVLQFQVDALGKREGNFCVLDVSQMSCPKQTGWILGPMGISWLKTKEAYKSKIIESRCVLFSSLLNSRRPSLVIFYGSSRESRHLWYKIAGAETMWESLLLPASCHVRWSHEPHLSWRRDERTLFIMMPHPNGIRPSGKGACTRFYLGFGQAIAAKLGLCEPKVVTAIHRWRG
jgi:hypothetical protein